MNSDFSMERHGVQPFFSHCAAKEGVDFESKNMTRALRRFVNNRRLKREKGDKGLHTLKGMVMKLLHLASIISIAMVTSPIQVDAACCAWEDRDACASCPNGYASVCTTQGNKCDCSCAKQESEVAQKASHGNFELQKYIEQNYTVIVRDTIYRGYHEVPSRFGNVKLAITPPK